MKFTNLGIFQSLKLSIIREKYFEFLQKLKFTPNILGYNGLNASLLNLRRIMPQNDVLKLKLLQLLVNCYELNATESMVF